MARDLNDLKTTAAKRQEEAADNKYGDVLVVLEERVDGLTGRDRIEFLTRLEAFLADGTGAELTPATQNDGATPALALGGGTPPPSTTDPLVAQFAALVQTNRHAAEALMDLIGQVVSLQSTNAALARNVSSAILYIVGAATKPEASHTPQEKQWVIVDNGGEPELKAHRDARQSAAVNQATLNKLTPVLQHLAHYGPGALDTAAFMARRVFNGTADTLNQNSANGLEHTLNAVKDKVVEAAATVGITPTTP